MKGGFLNGIGGYLGRRIRDGIGIGWLDSIITVIVIVIM
jgi:hypothetical protein